MTPYRDVSGHSGVDAYEARSTAIHIRFKHSRDIYIYDHSVPGKKTVDEMKRLAVSGEGLSTYISQVVKDRYAKKI